MDVIIVTLVAVALVAVVLGLRAMRRDARVPENPVDEKDPARARVARRGATREPPAARPR